MSQPKLADILHVLRNPYGWSQEAIRAAQLAACDLLEAAAPVPAREWELYSCNRHNWLGAGPCPACAAFPPPAADK